MCKYIYLARDSHNLKYSISAFEKGLDTRFIQVHRSYIINNNKISAYTKKDIEIGKLEILIGDNYKNNIDDIML